MYQDKYIAEKKIVAATVLEIKTPALKEIIEVSFEDGSKEVMPKMRFEQIVTDEISDASTVQQSIRKHVAAMLYSTMHEYGCKLGESEQMLNATSELINNGYNSAVDALFGFTYNNLSLLEINGILIAKYAEENNNGGSSTGEGSNN